MRANVRGDSAVLQCEFRNGCERLSVSSGWKMMHIGVCLMASVVHRDSEYKGADDLACNLTC